MGFVYLIGSRQFGWYKIGKSLTPEARVRNIGEFLPFIVEVFAIWKTDNHTLLETFMHGKFSNHRINGEWFSFTWDEANDACERAWPWNATRVAKLGDISAQSTLTENIVVDGLKRQKTIASVAFRMKMLEHLKGIPNPTKEDKEQARQLAIKARDEDLRVAANQRKLSLVRKVS
jgi:hypothetical protein